MKRWIGCGFLSLALAGGTVGLGAWSVRSYQILVREKIEVEASWSRVENVYQRRFSLTTHFAESARVAGVDEETERSLVKSCERVSQIILSPEILNDPQRLRELQRLDELQAAAIAAALRNLGPAATSVEVAELGGRLRATRDSLTEQSDRFDRAARRYNRILSRFPMSWFARAYGFHAVPLIEATARVSSGLADGEGAAE